MGKQNVLIFYFLLLAVLFLDIRCANKNKEEIYALRVEDLGDLILVQSAACLSQSKAYTAVWEYVKATGEEFESAATHILGPERKETEARFNQNKEKIDEFLKKAENPIEEYRPAYEKLLAMYGHYVKLHDLALKPAAPQEEYEASVYKIYNELLKEAGELNKLLGN